MSKKVDKNLITLLFALILFIVFVPTSFFVMKKQTANVFEKYPLLKSYESIHTVITKLDVFKGTTLIKDDKGNNVSIRAFNWDIKQPSLLYDNLEKGDSISRIPYSDTLYLYKKKVGTVKKFRVQFLE